MSISVQPSIKESEEATHLLNGVNGTTPTQFKPPPLTPTAIEPQSQAGLRVSEEEYWRIYYHDVDFDYEWNNGILEEKPMAKVRGSDQYQWFLALVNAYKQTQPGMRVVNLEIGFRLPLAEKTTIRKPDLFVVLNDNPVAIHDDDYSFAGICDVCVESLSDSAQSEIDRDVIHKRDEYAEIGVREYYILDCEGRYTTFYRTARQSQTGKRRYELLPISEDGVVRSEAMPGFQFRVRDLYHQPPFEEMVEDEVYRGYVWLEYQAQRERAEQESLRANEAEIRAEQERLRAIEADARAEQDRIRAEQERVRAEQAEARNRKYEAQLRALGLLDEDEAVA